MITGPSGKYVNDSSMEESPYLCNVFNIGVWLRIASDQHTQEQWSYYEVCVPGDCHITYTELHGTKQNTVRSAL